MGQMGIFGDPLTPQEPFSVDMTGNLTVGAAVGKQWVSGGLVVGQAGSASLHVHATYIMSSQTLHFPV